MARRIFVFVVVVTQQLATWHIVIIHARIVSPAERCVERKDGGDAGAQRSIVFAGAKMYVHTYMHFYATHAHCIIVHGRDR